MINRAITAACAILVATSALADSSGNFTAAGSVKACSAVPATWDPVTGSFGYPNGGPFAGGTNLAQFSTSIQTPSGNGTTLKITPNLATGLFTSTKLTTTLNNATADVGVLVCVYVDPVYDGAKNTYSGGFPVNPAPGAPTNNCVVYDQRIQQVSNTLFGVATACVQSGVACTTDAQCTTAPYTSCSNPTGGTLTGQCTNPACNFSILLTTLSAHSFDFVVPNMTNGSHNVVMTWGLFGQNASTQGGSTAACVGPAIVTVEQVKNFSNTATISFTSN